MATPTSSLSLPDRNHQARELLSVLADVLNLADAMGVTVGTGGFTGRGDVQVQLDDPARGRDLATAISNDPRPRHLPSSDPARAFTTWTATHRGVRVVVFGAYAGETAGVAS